MAHVRPPRGVHEDVIDAVLRLVADGDHHVAAPARPMPTEGERLALTADLIGQLCPGERSVACAIEGEAVFVELRPTAIDAGTRYWAVRAVGSSEAAVCLNPLAHVVAKKVHDHLAARRPAPHARLLRMQGDRE